MLNCILIFNKIEKLFDTSLRIDEKVTVFRKRTKFYPIQINNGMLIVSIRSIPNTCLFHSTNMIDSLQQHPHYSLIFIFRTSTPRVSNPVSISISYQYLIQHFVSTSGVINLK